MLLRRFINAVVMLLVASGLLLAPLAAPVMARSASEAAHHRDMPVMPHDTAAMSGDIQTMSDDTQAMADDMPCCPGQTGINDCGSCPFVALCLLSVSLPAPSGAISLIERHARRNSRALSDDLLIDGLGARPPDHPPRTPV
ncbi:hypothetical protein [Bradyrhizobium monzae]|uniref:hypothetical protein n=1 Tax=Bradyrhizobium sp. Oc8 TaxID=2876780 RepID=UPI001F36AFE7|nr:hypothetical protein [Bradyrhizobium sp. Oc8]